MSQPASIWAKGGIDRPGMAGMNTAIPDASPVGSARALMPKLTQLNEVERLNVAQVAYSNKGWGSLGPKSPQVISELKRALPENALVLEMPWRGKVQPVVINPEVLAARISAMQADPELAAELKIMGTTDPVELMKRTFAEGRTDREKYASDAIHGALLGVTP